MINKFSNQGVPKYDLLELVLDDESDVQNLPTNCAPGSLALVISSGNLYVMKSNKTWVKFE